MHELGHTDFGGNLKDPIGFGATGPVVDRINIVRAQLGKSFGQRLEYQARSLSPTYILATFLLVNKL